MVNLIQALKQVQGAMSYDGDASVQVLLPTGNGRYVRVGITDDDVAEKLGIWFDFIDKEIITGIPLCRGCNKDGGPVCKFCFAQYKEI